MNEVGVRVSPSNHLNTLKEGRKPVDGGGPGMTGNWGSAGVGFRRQRTADDGDGLRQGMR